MNGLPYGQFLRIQRICSNEDDYRKPAAKQAAQLIQHGYPKEALLETMLKAYNKGRIAALLPRPTNHRAPEVENIYLTTTYNAAYMGLQTQVSSTWDLLGQSSTTRFLQEKPLKLGYRRPKNLRNILVRAKLPNITDDQNNKTTIRESCKNSMSRYCPRLNKTGHITWHSTGEHKQL